MLYVVHYGEIALKGGNRGLFERALARNLLKAVRPLGPARVTRLPGRLLVWSEGEDGKVREALAKVFGVEYFAPAVPVKPPSYEGMRDALLGLARALGEPPGGSFKIEVKRAHKGFPLTSPELASRLGQDLRQATGWRVSLKEPGRTFHVEVLSDLCLLYGKRIRGPGGLPVGVSGRVLLLLSGGIDSPVAGWLLMKRGCQLGFLHLYAYGSAEEALSGKVGRILLRLSEYGAEGKVFLAPYHRYQLASLRASEGLELVLFKRFMLKLGAELARRYGYEALATGDGLAQVASQTLQNLAAQSYLLPLPVLRPLLTYDKKEIVALARQIGTYELSLQPYKDCCSLIARHPETRARAERLLKEEEKIGLDAIVAETLAELAVYELSSAALRPAKAQDKALEARAARIA